jgi:RNA polymerase-binding transcription factor DksA
VDALDHVTASGPVWAIHERHAPDRARPFFHGVEYHAPAHPDTGGAAFLVRGSPGVQQAGSVDGPDPGRTGPVPPAVAALRRRLRAERASVGTEVAALVVERRRLVEATTAANADDEHDPEGATIAFECAQADALRGQAERRLADLDDALGRLDAGTYGICETCRRPIAADRLAARPAARTCIECARRRH